MGPRPRARVGHGAAPLLGALALGVLSACAAGPPPGGAGLGEATTDPLAPPEPEDLRRAKEHLGRAEDLVFTRDPRRLPEALAAVDEALRLRPGLARAHSLRGFVLKRLDRPEEALASYSAALADGIDSPGDVHYWRGRVRHELGDHRGAIADLTSAVALRPSSEVRAVSSLAQALRERGRAHLALEAHGEALADVSAALAFDPDDVLALVLRARAWLELALDELALRDLDHALRVEEGATFLLRERARVHLLRGDPGAALRDAEAALRGGAPEDDRAHLEALRELAREELQRGGR